MDNYFTESGILPLPTPVQRYFRTCGYIGRQQRMQCRIVWSDVQMRFAMTGSWKKIECDELLSAAEPARIAQMRTHGLLPVTAKDEYKNGHGSMRIKLAGLITLQNSRGREMDQSGLVTILSECLLLPSCALQPYIWWKETGENNATAIIRYNETEAEGIFHFNDRDEFTAFETCDRWQSQKNGSFARTPWKVTAADYIDDGGLRRPRTTAASWLTNGQWWEYFNGNIAGIR